MSWLLVIALLFAGSPPQSQHRNPGAGPVDIDFNDPPADMKAGDTTTTTVVFRSNADVDQLEVFLVPDDGLEVLSGSQHQIFANVKRGDAPQIELRVRLMGAGASLNVSYVTVEGDRKRGGDISIDYGDVSQ